MTQIVANFEKHRKQYQEALLKQSLKAWHASYAAKITWLVCILKELGIYVEVQ